MKGDLVKGDLVKEQRPQVPVFVLSSGRSGSTLLAKMIHRHPRMLCVSDLIEPVGEIPYFDAARRVDGAEFFRVLSQPSFKQRTKFWRRQSNSELLFLHEDDNMVSLLLSYTLPFAAGGDPMELYHELKQDAAAWGEDSMPNHLIRFFEWLRDRFGKDFWVERTGGSLPHTRKIVETWPEAKFVHNYRDSRETAISMMKGSFFRLYHELEKNPDLDEWDMDYFPPVEELGAMLNGWTVDAVAALETVPEDRRLNLSYEELMESPAETLLRFSGFVLGRSEPEPEDIAWAEEEEKIIRPARLRFPTLDAETQQRLQSSVQGALEALGYV